MSIPGVRKALLTSLALAAIGCIAAPAAGAQQGDPTAPYDGQSPFNCELQDVGTGTAFPHPEAEPFCVEFDKTQQNITGLGLLDFVSKEPDRVAAAGPKCFYFQRDHWTGSIVQGSQTETYHYDGSYWYDQATGRGGVRVDNFRLGGQPADSSQFVPDQYKPYFGKGGGGAYTTDESQVRPDCLALVDSAQKRRVVYAHNLDSGAFSRRRIGPLALGTARTDLLADQGLPYQSFGGSDRFRVNGGGQLRAAYRGAGKEARIAALLSTAPKTGKGAIHPGDAVGPAKRALHARRAFRLGTFRVFTARRGKHAHRGLLLIGASAGKIGWLAIADPRRIHSRKGLKGTLLGLAFGSSNRVDSANIPY